MKVVLRMQTQTSLVQKKNRTVYMLMVSTFTPTVSLDLRKLFSVVEDDILLDSIFLRSNVVDPTGPATTESTAITFSKINSSNLNSTSVENKDTVVVNKLRKRFHMYQQFRRVRPRNY
jgi:hypothetical protein